MSRGSECTISRSFPSPLQQTLLHHTSAVSAALEDYRGSKKKVGRGEEEEEAAHRKLVGEESKSVKLKLA